MVDTFAALEQLIDQLPVSQDQATLRALAVRLRRAARDGQPIEELVARIQRCVNEAFNRDPLKRLVETVSRLSAPREP
jgi:hypothetical protein